jgi:hypothetical protein
MKVLTEPTGTLLLVFFFSRTPLVERVQVYFQFIKKYMQDESR